MELEQLIKHQQERTREVDEYLFDLKLRESSRNEYYKILTKQKLKLELELDISKDKNLTKLYKEIKKLKDEKSKESDTKYLGFFTFNFSPEITLEQVFICMNKIISKKWFIEYSYTIEQRGESLDELGKGLHVHLLFNRNQKRPSECVRECYNTFSKYTGITFTIFNQKCCKFYPLEYYQDKIQYMSGEKWEQDKMKKVEMDKEFRRINDIKVLYTN